MGSGSLGTPEILARQNRAEEFLKVIPIIDGLWVKVSIRGFRNELPVLPIRGDEAAHPLIEFRLLFFLRMIFQASPVHRNRIVPGSGITVGAVDPLRLAI